MPDNLIINPFLEVHVDSENETDFLLFAPKKDEGLQILRINNSQDESLHKLITQYSKIGLQYIDLKEDLTLKEIEVFKKNAILIDENEKSEKPLFSCQLDDVEVDNLVYDFNDLIVNPTFRFEPMNLATFKEWIYQKHLSPQQATVWIENPVTKIKIGYWLNPRQTEIVSKLSEAQAIPNNLDENTLVKLVSAQIIVSKKQFDEEIAEWKKIVGNAKEQFAEQRNIAIENLFPSSQMTAIKGFYRDYISQGFMEFGDEFVKRRYRQHNEPLARQFHNNFAKLMSKIVGVEIVPTYCYAASYLEGAELKPHTDRKQCEFSISFQVDYEPTQEADTSQWDLHLAFPEQQFEKETAFSWDEFHNDTFLSGSTKAIKLKNGDGLFYKGRDLIHYRYSLPQNHKSTSLFFHYVSKDFEGDLL